MPGKKRKLTHNNSDDQDIPAVNRHRPLLSVICDLSLSWRDPAAGPSLARLCRIIPRSSPGHGMQQQQLPSSDNYDLEWENIIPPSMDTSKEVVMELASWYCANAMPHFSKVCNVILLVTNVGYTFILCDLSHCLLSSLSFI